MSNSKISALPVSTTPLAGTEVLPIVQSGTTKQVSVADLTAGRAVSASTLTATSGTITAGVNSSAAGLVRVWSGTNDKRIQLSNDGTNSYINSTYGSSGGSPLILQVSDQDVVKLGTDLNVAISNAAKGINFTANTALAGMTSQLLNWYEEGTWTPVITLGGATTGITYTTQVGKYTRIGRQVVATVFIVLSSKGSATGTMRITGVPYAPGTSGDVGAVVAADNLTLSANGSPAASLAAGSTSIVPSQIVLGTAFTLSDTNLTNTSVLRLGFTYFV